MFCGNCGEKLLDGDAFCGVCGTPAEDSGAPAPATAAPQRPAPAPQPPAPSKPRPAAPAPQAAAPGKDRKALKKKLPEKADAKDKKPPAEKKSGGKGVLVLLLVLILGGAAAAWYFLAGPGAGAKPDAPARTSGASADDTMDVKGFAGKLCDLAQSNPMTIDSELYNVEFHARMSATPELLSSSGYSTEEYLEFAKNDIREQMSAHHYEKCSECKVAKAETMGCASMYNELTDALDNEGVSYDKATVNAAGRAAGLKSCGIIVLHQTWSGGSAPSPIAYFVGSDGGSPKVLNYFYSEQVE